jgi:hypothetical protein
MKRNQKEKQITINKQIINDYLTPHEGKVEFMHEETDSNCTLNYDLSRYFDHKNEKFKIFINKEESNKLSDLFIKYKMPERINNDLIFAYISMRFASLLFLQDEMEAKSNEKNRKEACDIKVLFDSINSGEVSLTEITFLVTSSSPEAKKNKRLTIKNDDSAFSAIRLMQSLIKNYKNDPEYAFIKNLSDIIKNPSPFKKIEYPNKNLLKEKQGDYCKKLYDYLNKEMFPLAFEHPFDYTKHLDQKSKLNAQYKFKKRLLFIGELMFLSDLLPNVDIYHEEKLFQLMKKKLVAKEKFDTEHRKLSRELNSNPAKYKVQQ